MSIKTMKKRVAVVAASALTVGFLSVVSAPVANAAIAAGDLNTTTTTASPGICAVDQTAGAQAVVLVSGRTFELAIDSTASQQAVYIGAAGSVKVQTSSAFDTSTETYVYDHANAAYAAESMSVTVVAGAVGTGTLTVRPSSTGSAVEVVSFNVVAACSGNTYSPTYSYAQVRNDANAATSNVDETVGLSVVNGGVGYVALLLKDAYNSTLTGTGALVANVSGGAIAAWESDPTVQSSTAYTTSLSDDTLHIMQGDANEDKPLTVTVNITLNGVSVASKTIKFQGIATTIEIKDVTVGKVASVGYWRARVLDAAGNALASKAVADDATANAAASISSIASISAGATTAADGDWTTTGTAQFSCVKGGTTTINVKHVLSSVTGASIKKSFPIACGDALDTWTISMDKATYQPGEVATLTVSGKDSKGFPVNSNDTLGTVGVALTTSFGGMTFVTAPSGGDKFTSAAGAKTYTLSVGTTEGSFVGTFTIAGATDTAAKTVQYKIANPNPGVSNADVLKSIVALIASINKQIQALQKLILKR